MTIGEQLYESVELDLVNSGGTDTYTFVREGGPLPLGTTALPLLIATSISPTQLAVGRGLGVRAQVKVRFKDSINDGDVVGGDPPAETTFWRLIRARYPFFNNREMRVKRGTVSGTTVTIEQTLTYNITKVEGPKRNGEFIVYAESETQRLARGRAQVPKAQTGTLLADISAAATSATIDGDATQYGTSGWLRIGDSTEVMAYTRSGTALTLTRGQLTSLGAGAAETHDAGDEIQEIAYWSDASVADVVYDCISDAVWGSIPDSKITKATWDTEDTDWLGFTLSGIIWDPTDTSEIIDELIRIFPFVLWHEESTDTFQFLGLEKAAFTAGTSVGEKSDIAADSFDVREDDDESYTRVLFYYGRKDPSESATDLRNYARLYPFINVEAEEAANRGESKVKRIAVRWFQTDDTNQVVRLGNLLQKIGERNKRVMKFKVAKESTLKTGDLVTLTTKYILGESSETETGIKGIVIADQWMKEGANKMISVQDTYYRANYRLWAPDSLTTAYDSASTADINTYLFYADDSNTLGTAADDAHDWL